MERLAASTLRQLRKNLAISTREVEESSRKLAEEKGNKNYFISTPRLSQIENESSLPSIYKLYALSLIYRVSYADLLRLYGMDIDQIPRPAELAPMPTGQQTRLEVYDKRTTLTFPVRLDPSFQMNRTHSLSHLTEIWGEIPLGFFQRLRPTSYHYGYLGLADRMMDPLVRPGSIVTIDTKRDKVQKRGWQNEFERPIYFIELRRGYCCSWCELETNKLTLLPHPLSPCHTKTLAYPDEAEIVGQVVAVAMRLLPPGDKKQLAAAKRPALP